MTDEIFTKELVNWCEENNINLQVHDLGAFYIEGLGICYYLMYDKKEKVFEGKKFTLNVKDHKYMAEQSQADYYVYQFGGQFYYTPIGSEECPQMNILKYVGVAERQMDTITAFLGVHGGYELLNGSRNYKDWCKKAKFFGYDALGIVERNTLAGIIPFQQACESNDIKPIIGETVIVAHKDDKLKEYGVKLYVKNKIGWRSLLKINKILNVDNNGYVEESVLLKNAEGLIAVVTPHEYQSRSLIRSFKAVFSDLYMQFDVSEWRSDQKDEHHLTLLKKYVNEYIDEVEPVFVNDAFYLDKKDSHIKRTLNGIGKVTYDAASNDQYMRSLDDYFLQLEDLFDEEDDRLFDIFQAAIFNASSIRDTCDYKIEFGKFHLPKYEMTESESEQFEDNEDMFFFILEEGLKNKVPESQHDEYMNRIELEVDVISRGGFVDYFLILWDIVEWCKIQRILTGIGRGSAGGSLVAYLMGITKLDPMRYGLMFERFLNEGRILKRISSDIFKINGDIEVDFEDNALILRNGVEIKTKGRGLRMGDEIISINGKEC